MISSAGQDMPEHHHSWGCCMRCCCVTSPRPAHPCPAVCAEVPSCAVHDVVPADTRRQAAAEAKKKRKRSPIEAMYRWVHEAAGDIGGLRQSRAVFGRFQALW